MNKPGEKPQIVTKDQAEKNLQEYISTIPESIIFNEVKEGAKLVIAAREFQTDSGPIDAIGFDNDGDIYLIETKLYKNPGRREIVAQILDYAASIYFMYPTIEEFKEELKRRTKKSLEEFLKKSFDLDENGLKIILENIKTNLGYGSFCFILIMDELDDKMKNQITYLNKFTDFQFYALELPLYKHNEIEISIPKIFGPEQKRARKEFDWDHYATLWKCSENEINFMKMFVKQLHKFFNEKNMDVSRKNQKLEISFKHKNHPVCYLGYDEGVYLAIIVPKKEKDPPKWDWSSEFNDYFQYFDSLPDFGEIEPLISEAYSLRI